MKWYHVSGFDNAIEDKSAGRTIYTDMPDSYSLSWRHDGTLPGNVWLSADVEYVDGIEYFEEFGDTADQYTRDMTVSTVLLQRNWDKLNTTLFGRYVNDLADAPIRITSYNVCYTKLLRDRGLAGGRRGL